MKAEIKPFGETSFGDLVFEYVLSEEKGISVSIISYGAAVRSVILPSGKDIVLGFDSISDYESHDKYMGATVGRCANRIAKEHLGLTENYISLPLITVQIICMVV